MRLRILIPDNGTHPPGMTFTRTVCVRLNRIRIRVKCFHSCMPKWGMASSAACELGAEGQTIDHVHPQSPTHRPSHGLHGPTVLDDETIEWLLNSCPEIDLVRPSSRQQQFTQTTKKDTGLYTLYLQQFIIYTLYLQQDLYLPPLMLRLTTHYEQVNKKDLHNVC